jgi:hypothetical protein
VGLKKTPRSWQRSRAAVRSYTDGSSVLARGAASQCSALGRQVSTWARPRSFALPFILVYIYSISKRNLFALE